VKTRRDGILGREDCDLPLRRRQQKEVHHVGVREVKQEPGRIREEESELLLLLLLLLLYAVRVGTGVFAAHTPTAALGQQGL